MWLSICIFVIFKLDPDSIFVMSCRRAYVEVHVRFLWRSSKQRRDSRGGKVTTPSPRAKQMYVVHLKYTHKDNDLGFLHPKKKRNYTGVFFRPHTLIRESQIHPHHFIIYIPFVFEEYQDVVSSIIESICSGIKFPGWNSRHVAMSGQKRINGVREELNLLVTSARDHISPSDRICSGRNVVLHY